MANVKISDLTAYTDPVATDVLPIVDLVNDQTKKVKVEDLLKKFGAGTEALPSFAFTGDLDTGIYSPGANQFAVSTGGTQRLLIDASGNTTIQGDLTVNGTTTTIESTTLSIDDKNIELGTVSTPSDTTADGGGITLKGATDKTINWVQSTGCWTFNQPTNFNNHVRIDSSGNVGIGTTSPARTLHVEGQARFGASTGHHILFNGASDKNSIISRDGVSAASGHPLAFRSGTDASAESMRLDTSGRLLVGKTSTAHNHLVQIKTSTNTDAIAIAGRSSDDASEITFYENDDSTILGQIQHKQDHAVYRHRVGYLRFDTGGLNERMRIDSSGRVLIGTSSSPSSGTGQYSFLVVQGYVGGAPGVGSMSLQRGEAATAMSDDDPVGVLNFNDNTGENFARIRASVDSTPGANDYPGRLEFHTTADGASSTTERMRIDSSGRVGVNTISAHSYYASRFVVDTGSAAQDGITIVSDSSNQGLIAFADGTSGTSRYSGYINYTHAANEMDFGVNGSQAMSIDSSGRLLVGTSSAPSVQQIQAANTGGENFGAFRFANNTGASDIVLHKSRGSLGSHTIVQNNDAIGSIAFRGSDGSAYRNAASINAFVDGTPGASDMPGRLVFSTTADGASSPTERMRIDSSGNVGIGTSSPGAKLDVAVDSNRNLLVQGKSGTSYGLELKNGSSNTAGSLSLTAASSGPITFNRGSNESARIDTSGRLLIGTTSSIGSDTYAKLNIIDPVGAEIRIGRNDSSVTDGNALGAIRFYGNDGGSYQECVRIAARADGDHANNDKPSRLEFYTTADGASSPTERMRITKLGELKVGVDNPSTNSYVFAKADGNTCYIADRLSSDGKLFLFRQGGTEEGSISVSGTTVSYNGAHLARWSQLAGGAERTEILRGSVLSNLDEMCEWGDEDNEQLNRMQVSNVEGDRNVAGVFQAWDDDDDTYINDFYCAMTGDFVIRIAQGTTVTRGDLLMSAGDGTAKPQGDGFVQDKTIAKVTSTTVSTTYADGSYCVPCVLMAC